MIKIIIYKIEYIYKIEDIYKIENVLLKNNDR